MCGQAVSEWMEYCLNLFRYLSVTTDSWNNRNAFTTSRYWLEKLFLVLEGYESDIVLAPGERSPCKIEELPVCAQQLRSQLDAGVSEPVFLCHESSVEPPRKGRTAPKSCNFDAKNIEVQSVLQSILRVFHQQRARGDSFSFDLGAPDVLGVAAVRDEQIPGIAGVSSDSPKM